MKKGELSFNVLVTALIALLVFIVLAIVFRRQLVELLSPITDLIKTIGGLGGEIGE